MRIGNKTDHAAIAENLLRISGGDTVTIDRKYKAAWTGRLPTRFLILSNELPHLADASTALAVLEACRSLGSRSLAAGGQTCPGTRHDTMPSPMAAAHRGLGSSRFGQVERGPSGAVRAESNSLPTRVLGFHRSMRLESEKSPDRPDRPDGSTATGRKRWRVARACGRRSRQRSRSEPRGAPIRTFGLDPPRGLFRTGPSARSGMYIGSVSVVARTQLVKRRQAATDTGTFARRQRCRPTADLRASHRLLGAGETQTTLQVPGRAPSAGGPAPLAPPMIGRPADVWSLLARPTPTVVDSAFIAEIVGCRSGRSGQKQILTLLVFLGVWPFLCD